VARVITFYVPASFRLKVQGVPPTEHGKVIEFPAAPSKKTA
jgi:hypothetical protein